MQLLYDILFYLLVGAAFIFWGIVGLYFERLLKKNYPDQLGRASSENFEKYVDKSGEHIFFMGPILLIAYLILWTRDRWNKSQ